MKGKEMRKWRERERIPENQGNQGIRDRDLLKGSEY